MAVGKYYSQTKLTFLLRQRERPEVGLLDEDTHTLVSVYFNKNLSIPSLIQRKQNQEQKAAHRLLLEYRQMLVFTFS